MVEEKIEEKVESPMEEAAPKVACPDCTVLVADGGLSEFSGKGGPKAGLINEKSLCPFCAGSGLVEALEELGSKEAKEE